MATLLSLFYDHKEFFVSLVGLLILIGLVVINPGKTNLPLKVLLAIVAAFLASSIPGTANLSVAFMSKGELQATSGLATFFLVLCWLLAMPTKSENDDSVAKSYPNKAPELPVQQQFIDHLTTELAQRESELKALRAEQLEERNRLQTLIDTLQARLQDPDAAYQAYIKELEQRIEALQALQTIIPEDQLKQAEAALAAADKSAAKALFEQIRADNAGHIAASAGAAFQLGKIAEDEIRYQQAFEHYATAVRLAPDNPLYLTAAGFMAGILAKHDLEIDWEEQALALYLAQYGEDTSEVAILHNNLGSAWHDKGDYDKAIEYYELALESDLNTYDADHPTVAIRHNNLGLAWQAKGDVDKAIEYFELALESVLNTYGADHPGVAREHNNLGLAWHAKGQYDKAIKYYKLALESVLNTYGADHPKVAATHNNLGMAWQAKGDSDKAIEYFELALESVLNTYGADHPKVAIRYNNLGMAWKAKGEVDKAIDYYELALKSDLNTYGADHPEVATDRNNLGSAWYDKGDYDKAIEYFELALASFTNRLGAAHPNTQGVKSNLELAIAESEQQNK